MQCYKAAFKNSIEQRILESACSLFRKPVSWEKWVATWIRIDGALLLLALQKWTSLFAARMAADCLSIRHCLPPHYQGAYFLVFMPGSPKHSLIAVSLFIKVLCLKSVFSVKWSRRPSQASQPELCQKHLMCVMLGDKPRCGFDLLHIISKHNHPNRDSNPGPSFLYCMPQEVSFRFLSEQKIIFMVINAPRTAPEPCRGKLHMSG